MARHWRSGHALLSFPGRGDENKMEEYVAKARYGWSRVTRYLLSIDPYRHPITIHPTDHGHNMVDGQSLLDIDMLQTGHSDIHSFENIVNMVVNSIAGSLRMPVLVGEVCYEGIMGASWGNV